MARWLRSSAVHFLIIGGLLFVLLDRLPNLYGGFAHRPERPVIVISSAQFRELQSDFERQWGAKPTQGQLKALIQQTIDDEVLYREARRLALDFEDRSIRMRLVQKMRAVSAGPLRSEQELYREAVRLGLDEDFVIKRLLREKMRLLLQQAPNGAALQEKDIVDYIERHRERFIEPAKVTFSHVFLSASVHGDRSKEEAQALLAELRSRSVRPEAAGTLSDPFPLGGQFGPHSQAGIARYFGRSFAERVFELEPGQWSGPIASPYGLHLVWVRERIPEKMPALESIWQRAAYAVLEERAAEHLASVLRHLRSLYDVRIEGGVSTMETSTRERS